MVEAKPTTQTMNLIADFSFDLATLLVVVAAFVVPDLHLGIVTPLVKMTPQQIRDFADAAPFGGPLYSQMVYEPSACQNGEGVASDGTLVWTGGLARYVYVLAAGTQSPTERSPAFSVVTGSWLERPICGLLRSSRRK